MTFGLPHFLIDPIIFDALKEDINEEDFSTNSVVDEDATGSVDLLAKEEGILAGLPVFERVFLLLDQRTKVSFFKKDGDSVEKGDKIATISGPLRALLTGERVALNFLQRMCGIATYTRQMALALENTKTQIADTRKTTPNFRLFAKYAVRIGGGTNHRYNLSDGVMLKDNHIAAAGSIENAVRSARRYTSFMKKIEVEVENMDMVKEAVAAEADIIMLDNMSREDMKSAVDYIAGRALVELSGNVTLENIKDYGDLGADIISSGSLTHSAPILDLSMKGLRHDPK